MRKKHHMKEKKSMLLEMTVTLWSLTLMISDTGRSCDPLFALSVTHAVLTMEVYVYFSGLSPKMKPSSISFLKTNS